MADNENKMMVLDFATTDVAVATLRENMMKSLTNVGRNDTVQMIMRKARGNLLNSKNMLQKAVNAKQASIESMCRDAVASWSKEIETEIWTELNKNSYEAISVERGLRSMLFVGSEATVKVEHEVNSGHISNTVGSWLEQAVARKGPLGENVGILSKGDALRNAFLRITVNDDVSGQELFRSSNALLCKSGIVLVDIRERIVEKADEIVREKAVLEDMKHEYTRHVKTLAELQERREDLEASLTEVVLCGGSIDVDELVQRAQELADI